MALRDAAIVGFAETKIVTKSEVDIWELGAQILEDLLERTGFEHGEIDGIAPKVAVAREVYERASQRGELRDDVDLDILTAALPGIVLHRGFLLGDPPTQDLIARVVDQVILPAATRG